MEQQDHDFYCPGCGKGTDTLYDGYCETCRGDRQARLNDHNFRYDRRKKLTTARREAEIKTAIEEKIKTALRNA